MNKEYFCHLHVHDQYSLLDGFGKAQNYAKRAKELGFEYLALTNHGNVDGLIKFQAACNEVGIKPVFGCEMYIVADAKIKQKGERRYHLILLVKDEKGWQNLLQLLTYANLEGFYWRPRIDYDTLFSHLEGLIVLTACTSSFLLSEEGEDIFGRMVDKIPDDLYLEIMPHLMQEQIALNKVCLRLSKEYNIPIVATNDCHYILPEDSKVQEVLLAIQYKAKWKDPKRKKFDIQGLYLRTSAEMFDAFERQASLPRSIYGPAVFDTVAVAEKCCGFQIKKAEVHLPVVYGYEGAEDKEFLKELCDSGMKEKGLDKVENPKEYEDRYKEEFDTITNLGFTRYFLIVWELIKWCKKNDIMVGPGRGSVGGCLIAYLLGITAVDPLKFGLIFSRFISPARIDLPDIDMDFEDIKRDRVREHLEDLYGKENVASVSTFLTLKGRAAIRDVARVFDVPLVDVNAASKSIVVRSGGDFRSNFTIEDAFETFEDGRRFKKKYPEVSKIAVKLEGQVRGVGMHAAGIVVSKESLHDGKRAVLCLRKQSQPTVNWGKEDTEYVGLMKLDVLGLNALTILNEIRKAVKENYSVDLDYEAIPLDINDIYKEFTAGHTVGCFQFGSLGLRKMCQELVIDNFKFLTAMNALHRPGTIRSGMATEYIARKTGQKVEGKDWDYMHPYLKKLTADTFGIILYQEQVMNFMYELGGLPWKTADTVRKVISKSKGVEQFKSFEKQFIDGCKKKGTLEPEVAKKIWGELASFGSYGFNKAHSVEYSLIAYWQMYCKIHHPAEFVCCSLTYGSDAKKEDMVEEAKRLGFKVKLPMLGFSDPIKWVAEKKDLYIPFAEIKGIGSKMAKKLAVLKDYKSGGMGFFTQPQEKEIASKIGAKATSLLKEIGALEPGKEQLQEDKQDYFSFNISEDVMRRVRGIRDWIAIDKEIKKVEDVDVGTIDKKQSLYFGQMTEIKFGYRGKIDTLKKKLDISGVAGSLGGVYGNFKDDTDFVMLVFGGEIYNRKKDLIEHCGEEWMVVSCNQPSRAGSIMCQEIWAEEELIEGKLKGLHLNLAVVQRTERNKGLLSCNNCDLRQGCKAPVLFSIGRYNIMIVGEAPGWEEDREGVGFIGGSGDLLWKELEKFGLYRELFYMDNVVKCWPGKGKTPTKKQIKACSIWLKEEIEQIKPFLILAFGNTCMNFFKDRDSGIMDMSGKTEWNYEYGAWICWSIHPAAVLYHPENLDLLKKGLDNFAEKVEILGGIKNLRNREDNI